MRGAQQAKANQMISLRKCNDFTGELLLKDLNQIAMEIKDLEN
jgi:hypothetical protein